MKVQKSYKRHDGTIFKAEMEIDIDALMQYMAGKADRNVSKKCSQVEKSIRLKIL